MTGPSGYIPVRTKFLGVVSSDPLTSTLIASGETGWWWYNSAAKSLKMFAGEGVGVLGWSPQIIEGDTVDLNIEYTGDQDVYFFANRADPGTGVMADADVPEIGIWGWDHADTALRYLTINVQSVGVGANPDDTEHAYAKFGLDPNGSRAFIICDGNDNPELTAAFTDPTFRMYDNTAVHYFSLSVAADGTFSIEADGGIALKPSGDSDDYILFTTNSNVPGFTSIGACDLDLQNQGVAAVYDVQFFNRQTVPAATPAVGSTPELRVYGWSSNTIATQVYSVLRTSALNEAVAQTGDEIGVLRIEPANRLVIIEDIGETVEITAAAAPANPTLRIYDAGGTDYLQFYDDGTNSRVQSTNPVYISPLTALTGTDFLFNVNGVTPALAIGFDVFPTGNALNIAYDSAQTLSAGTLRGLNINFNTNLTGASTAHITALEAAILATNAYTQAAAATTEFAFLKLSAIGNLATSIAAGTLNFFGLDISDSVGSVTSNFAGSVINWYGFNLVTPIVTTTLGTTNTYGLNLGTAGAVSVGALGTAANWYGLNLAMPNITQTAGSLTSQGLRITGGTLNSGTQNAIYITGNYSASGMLDLNPSGTGAQNVIDITPTVGLVAGSTWQGLVIDAGNLDPAAGAASTIIGVNISYATLLSDDASMVGYRYNASTTGINVGYDYQNAELTVNQIATAFRYVSGTIALSATATYRGLWIGMAGLARDGAAAPVLEGIRIDWPASTTSFGTSYPFILTDGTNTLFALTMATEATVLFDINPRGTGTQNVIDITPAAALAAGSTWTGISVNGDSLDPLNGAITYVIGYKSNLSTVTSADGNAELLCYDGNPSTKDRTDIFRGTLSELTTNVSQNTFLSLGGTVGLDATATYRGLWIDWDGITRNAGSPVMEGIRIDWIGDYTSFGTSYALMIADKAWTQSIAVDNTKTISLLSGGALTQQTLNGTLNWVGQQISIGNITQTTGKITAVALDIDVGSYSVVDNSTTLGTVIDIRYDTPALTLNTPTAVNTVYIYGQYLTTAGNITTSHANSAIYWIGSRLAMPVVTQTLGTCDAYGFYAGVGDFVTGGTSRAFYATLAGHTVAAGNSYGFEALLGGNGNGNQHGVYVRRAAAITGVNAATQRDVRIEPAFTLTYPAGGETYTYIGETSNFTSITLTPVALATLNLANYQLTTPALTNSTTATTAIRGVYLPTAGALVQNTAAGTINWYGVDLSTPTATTAGAVVSRIDVFGWRLGAAGAVTTGVAGNIINWYGASIQLPAVTQTGGTATVYGHYLKTGAYTSGTVYFDKYVDSADLPMFEFISRSAAITHPTMRIYDNGGTDYLEFYNDDANSFINSPANDLIIKGEIAATVYDVEFFSKQTDPGSLAEGVITVGEVPEIRIYGWNHGTSALVFSGLATSAVSETVQPTDNELAAMRIYPANNLLILQESTVTNIEITAAQTNPTLRLYDGGDNPVDYIEIYQGDTNSAVIYSTQIIAIITNGDSDDNIQFYTTGNVPGFFSSGACDLAVQNQGVAAIYDVTFFANQTDPGSAVDGAIAAGEVPETRIYGWSHAGGASSGLTYASISVVAVGEGATPTDDEYAYLKIGVPTTANRNSRTVIICDDADTPEITAVFANPVLKIYDAGATDFIAIYDDGAIGYILDNVNPIYFRSGNGSIRVVDADDTDYTCYLDITAAADGTYVSLVESGNTKQTALYAVGISGTDPSIDGGAVLMHTGLAATGWVAGDYAGSAATKGLWTFNAIADEVLFGIPVPGLMVDTGTAGDWTFSFLYTITNATDRFDYAVYRMQADGTITQIVAALDQALGAVSGTYSINLGALTFNKGDKIVFAMRGFETNVAGVTTATFQGCYFRHKVGIENDTA